MCPSSDPSTATVSAQLLNESIIILLSKPSHAARIHLTISLRGGACMFPAAVKEWASPAIHSSYFSVTFALNGLFQSTSGAWMYFVQPPGMIKGSIFDVRSSCLTVSITWNLNESHAKIRRVNENFPRTLLTQSRNYVLTWTLQLRNSDEDHCFCNTLLRMSAITGR